MRQVKINLYTFDELSESAKSRAWEEWASTTGEFYDNSEYRATLAAFEKAFDVDVYQWYVDENCYNFAFAHNREPAYNGPVFLCRFAVRPSAPVYGPFVF